MRALVVYESMFGNTRAIAEAIATGLQPQLQVDCVEVGAAPVDLSRVDLLAVGGPTHAFGMTRASTREDAQNQADAPVVSSNGGIREWLHGLAAEALPARAVAFDTRVHRPRVPGSAGRAAGRVLRRHGVVLVRPSESYWVDGVRGPLIDGEVARARRWATEVAAEVAGSVRPDNESKLRPAG